MTLRAASLHWRSSAILWRHMVCNWEENVDTGAIKAYLTNGNLNFASACVKHAFPLARNLDDGFFASIIQIKSVSVCSRHIWLQVPAMELHLQSRLGADQVWTSGPLSVRFQPESWLGITSKKGAVATTQGWSSRHTGEASPVQLGSLGLRLLSLQLGSLSWMSTCVCEYGTVTRRCSY
jgi:hypothetical protein